jgi:hypothetical protein
MNRAFRLLRASATIFAAVTLLGAVSLAPERAEAVPVVGLAAILQQALPTIETILGKLFGSKPKQDQKLNDLQNDSKTGGKNLEVYVKRAQILSTIVGASGEASTSIANMISDIAGKTQLTETDLNDMSKSEWPKVTAALDDISGSKPDLEAFEGDTTAVLAIKRIMDKGLSGAIKAQLTYNPSKPDPKLVTKLQNNLIALQTRFTDVGQVAGIELQFVADGLAQVSAATQLQGDKKADVSAKATNIKKSAFGGNTSKDLTDKSEAYFNLLKGDMASQPSPKPPLI